MHTRSETLNSKEIWMKIELVLISTRLVDNKDGFGDDILNKKLHSYNIHWTSGENYRARITGQLGWTSIIMFTNKKFGHGQNIKQKYGWIWQEV